MGKIIDLTNKKFGRLTAISYLGSVKSKRNAWLCECDCGNKKIVSGRALREKTIVSCGCYRREIATINATKHGHYDTRIYRIWFDMKRRCQNKNRPRYNDYGGRGITVCPEWIDKKYGFKNFYEWAINNGYSDKLSIDRINVNGNYEPGNCRWSDKYTQARNTRANKVIEYKGEKHSLAEWVDKLGLKYSRVKYRLNRGYSVEQSFNNKKIK